MSIKDVNIRGAILIDGRRKRFISQLLDVVAFIFFLQRFLSFLPETQTIADFPPAAAAVLLLQVELAHVEQRSFDAFYVCAFLHFSCAS